MLKDSHTLLLWKEYSGSLRLKDFEILRNTSRSTSDSVIWGPDRFFSFFWLIILFSEFSPFTVDTLHCKVYKTNHSMFIPLNH